MNRDDAIAYVKMQAITSDDPALSDAEVGLLVDLCAIADKAGHAPADPDWTPTYWAIRAVADAWTLKVDKAAQWVSLSTDGTTLAVGEAYTHLEKAASRWRRRCAAST